MEQHIEDISDLPKFSLECLLFRARAKILIFYYEDGQTLEQVAQRDCGTSSLGGRQNLTGRGPEQPALNGPALSRVGLGGLQRPLPTYLMH